MSEESKQVRPVEIVVPRNERRGTLVPEDEVVAAYVAVENEVGPKIDALREWRCRSLENAPFRRIWGSPSPPDRCSLRREERQVRRRARRAEARALCRDNRPQA